MYKRSNNDRKMIEGKAWNRIASEVHILVQRCGLLDITCNTLLSILLENTCNILLSILLEIITKDLTFYYNEVKTTQNSPCQSITTETRHYPSTSNTFQSSLTLNQPASNVYSSNPPSREHGN